MQESRLALVTLLQRLRLDAVTERRTAEAQVLARHTCYAGFSVSMTEGRA
jgi:hypothetical protein